MRKFNFARSLKRWRQRKSISGVRYRLAKTLMERFDGCVQYGPLKGYRIPPSSTWGFLARPSMLLGIYEAQLLPYIIEASKDCEDLVDIGAADGFWGLGLIHAGLFRRGTLFEANSDAHAVLLEGAALNNLTEKVQIMGEARDFVIANKLNSTKALVLCDIEGSEFDVFSFETIDALRHCHVIIELHDFMLPDGAARREEMVRNFSKSHRVTIIGQGPRDVSSFKELAEMNDDERLLVASESRAQAMEWLVATPKEHQ